MSQKPQISITNTIHFLQAKFGSEVSELTLLSGGEWSQAYSFVYDRQKYVLRWGNSDEAFAKDAFAATFNSKIMPVPKIIDIGKKLDQYFAISEFASGKFIDTLDSVELAKTLPALLRLFDTLRNIDLTESTGYGSWGKNGMGSSQSWREYLLDVKNDRSESITHGWYANLLSSPLGTKVFDQLYAQLASLVDQCPEIRELIHSDLLNYNLLVADAKISAVLDWQCSLYGDSLYDVAWFVFYAPWYPQFAEVQLCQKIIAHFVTTAANTANLSARLFCYQLHIGLGWIAYNAFKKDWPAVQEAVEHTLKVALAQDKTLG